MGKDKLTTIKNTASLSLEYPLNTTLKNVNYLILNAYLKRYNHNISRVSKLLNVSRQTVYNWMKDANI